MTNTLRFSRWLVWLLVPWILLSGCKEEKKGTLQVRFLAEYDGAPLQTFNIYPFDAPQRISFTHLSYFVSDLALLDGNDKESVQDIALVDLSFDNQTAAEEGFVLTLDNVPARSYDGIEFGIGVPPNLNDNQPADFPSSNPLSKVSYYWDAWDSYIFMKNEGRLDTLGNGDLGLGFAIHTGSDPLYRILSTSAPVEVTDGGITEIHVVLDYYTLLSGVDIKAKPQNHSPTDTLVISTLVSHLPQAVSLRL